MRIGLIFGSFNPIHKGHIGIGKLSIDAGLVDEVWYVIAKQNPFKDNYGVSFYDRENMLAIALVNPVLEGYRMRSINVENFSNDDAPRTYNTLTSIKKTHDPVNEYIIICGDDMFTQIPTWYNGQDIIDNHKFIVYYRDAVEPFSCDNVIALNTNGLEDISSTKIREMIKNNDDNVYEYVNNSVVHYIKDFNLYL
jgi:nicotinate-nucleotide adenylyltransferase